MDAPLTPLFSESFPKGKLDNITAVVETVLEKYLKNTNVDISTFLEGDYRSYWIKAFTPSITSISNNFESFEYLGDKIYGATLSRYIFARLGVALPEPNILTKLYNKYSGNRILSVFSRKLGISNHILLLEDMNSTELPTKMYADLFESFIGCLQIVCDNIRPGMGYLVCHEFIFSLLDEYQTLDNDRKQEEKIVAIESFFRMTKPTNDPPFEPEIISDPVTRQTTYRLKFSTQHIQAITSGIGGTPLERIYESKENDREDARVSLYMKLAALIERKTLYTEYIPYNLPAHIFEKGFTKETKDLLKEKKQELGYYSVKLFAPTGGSDVRTTYAHLIGVRKSADGKFTEERLCTARNDKEHSETLSDLTFKMRLVKMFLAITKST